MALDSPTRVLRLPENDPTPIFDAFRGNYQTEILTAAVKHFGVFDRLKDRSQTFEDLAAAIKLEPRPAHVLLAGLCAMGLLARSESGGRARYELTPAAREHLLSDSPTYIGDYVGMAAESAGVLELVERLVSNRAAAGRTGADDSKGSAFTFRPGEQSAMDDQAAARQLTLALAGRAKNVAPVLAERFSLKDRRVLLDIGGGTGVYSFAFLQRNPSLRAVIWDRAEVLRVAEELARSYGVADRCEFRPGDMFADPLPSGCDVMLLSNILHDWDVAECQALIARAATALPVGGSLLIHDAFLNDNLDGPLPVALYSAALFCVTEGRAYSGAEYRQWLVAAGLSVGQTVPTLVNCSVIGGVKA